MSENNINENAAGDSTPLPEIPKFPEGLRVLAVDDEPISLKTLTVMLEKCKYQGSIHTLIYYKFICRKMSVFLVVIRICVIYVLCMCACKWWCVNKRKKLVVCILEFNKLNFIGRSIYESLGD